MSRGSTEQPAPHLPARYRHCRRAGGLGLVLPRRATCSRKKTHNTRSEKRTTTVEKALSRSRRITGPLSTLCRAKDGFISYAIRPLGDIRRDPPRLIFGEQFRRRSPRRFGLVMDIR